MKSGQTVVMLKYDERNDMRHHGDEKLAETIRKRQENARGNKNDWFRVVNERIIMYYFEEEF